jgi:hypothetical protein
VHGLGMDMRMRMQARTVSGQLSVKFANEIQCGPTRTRLIFI